ncbi:hypothetical protein ACHQM5_021363 [Ranunculus cassubicifolius]
MATQSLPKTPKTSSKLSKSRNFASKVRVIARLRPFLPSEISIESCISVLQSDSDSSDGVVVHLTDRLSSRNECHKLDAFYEEENSVSEIFQKEVSPLISGVFNGCNSTVFACGATSSGKTHLMQGRGELLPGLMSLSMSMVLGACESSGNIAEISYYEVHMEKCYDLLQPKEKEISVLDDKNGQVHLRGLVSAPVSSMSEFREILSTVIQRRKAAPTALNDVSSRSHGVLVISVSSPPGNGSGPSVLGKLNLIDLAGNEDNRRTENEGIRLQESAKINRSLFTLSNVISALNNNEPRVPYRESKLTRILQDSLGGNNHSLMIACLNPCNYHESVSTMSLASRSYQITNYVSSARKEGTPSTKTDMEEKLRGWLESKGKSRSTQRLPAFGSPLLSKTPLSTTKSIKKQSSCKSYAKVKDTTGRGLANATRNLFKSEAPIGSSMEISVQENFSSYASKCHTELSSDQNVEENKHCDNVMQVDGTNVFKDKSSEDCTSLCGKQLDEINDMKIPEEHKQESPVDTATPLGKERHSESSTDINILDEDIHESCLVRVTSRKEIHMESSCVINVANEASMPESEASSPDEKQENLAFTLTPSKKIGSLQNSLRKVLSHINNNSNIKIYENITFEDTTDMMFLDPKTPKTPSVDGFQGTCTPLDKYNLRSSNLKSNLAQEYLEFLNSAKRDELLQLKGIGPRRADYILELRETSPLQSLNDLEKIGLSSKQVNHLFKKAATRLFN